MTVVRGQKARRWTLVAVIAGVVCALPAVLGSLPAGGTEPPAGQLRQLIAGSADQPYVGYARTSGELGLPSLPDLADVTSLLSGTTDIRVWYRSPWQNRVDVIDTVGERDVYTTPDGTYTWDYAANLLTEIVGTEPVRLPRAGDLVPPELARRVLDLDTTDPVVSLPARRIAGIDAAGLRLRPTDPATTVGQVDMWADPVSGLPLRVEVTARGATQPTLTSQFIDVTRGDPGDDALNPPVAGAGGVSEASAPDALGAIRQLGQPRLPGRLAGYAQQPQLAGLPGVARYGTGLSSFVVLALPANIGASAMDTATKGGGSQVTVTRGRAVLIQIPMLTVLLERLGCGRRSQTYLVAGLVNATVLRQAAAELATAREPVVR